MMRITVGLSALILAGCGASGGDGETPGAGAPVSVEDQAAMSACEAVEALAISMEADIPFKGLSQEAAEGEGYPRDLVTALKPWGYTCKHGILGGWNDGDPDSHVFRCTIFEASSLRFEEEMPNAQAAFDEAKATLDSCLPEGWTAREDSGGKGEEAQTFIYERASDIERSETADFYMHSIMLRKAFFRSPESRGGPWGWIVDVAFQQTEVAEAEPASE